MIDGRVWRGTCFQLAFLLVSLIGAAVAQTPSSPAPPAGSPPPASVSTGPALKDKNEETFYPKAISQLIEDVQNAAGILGILAAGIWAYFNFFRGRTYHPRLESQVSAISVATSQGRYLSITYRVKNVGLSKVDIQKKGTGLIVQRPDTAGGPVRFVRGVQWKAIGAFDIFEAHKWVEPGEPIQEQMLLALPRNDDTSFRIEVTVASAKGIEWTVMTVVTDDTPERAVANCEPLQPTVDQR